MECHEVQLLLTFAQRRCENLDFAENESLHQHLEKCPVCTTLAQGERALDESIGHILRDVPVPPGLKEKLTQKLVAERFAESWRHVARATGAVAAFLLLTGGVAWYVQWKPAVDVADVRAFSEQGNGWDRAQVEKYFAERGLPTRGPAAFNYEKLQRVDVVDFKGRRVPKLTFSSAESQADVLILSPGHFRLSGLPQDNFEHLTSIQIQHDTEDFTYLIFYRGELSALQQRQI